MSSSGDRAARKIDVVLTTADADRRVMLAFAKAMHRYASHTQAPLTWRVVDGLHAYGGQSDFLAELMAISDGVVLEWLHPATRLSQLDAVLYGLRASPVGANILTINPDMGDNLEDVEAFLQKQTEGAALVFAHRVRREGVSCFRHWLTHGFSAVARMTLAVPLRDFNSTMILVSSFAMTRLHAVPLDCPAPYLFVCHELRDSISEVPVCVQEFPGKKSSYGGMLRLKTSLVHFREMILFRLWLRRHNHHHRIARVDKQ